MRILLLLLFVLPLALTAQTDRSDAYLAHIQQKGYAIDTITSDYIVFTADSAVFLIETKTYEYQDFRMVLPGLAFIESQEMGPAHMAAANITSAKMSVVKVFMEGPSVVASIELLLEDPTQFTRAFDRSVEMLNTAGMVYYQELDRLMQGE